MSPTTMLVVLGVAAIFAGIFLSLTAMGAFTNEAKGVSKSLAVMDAFSAAPRAMQQEVDPGFSDRVLDPVLARLTGLVRRLTPSGYT